MNFPTDYEEFKKHLEEGKLPWQQKAIEQPTLRDRFAMAALTGLLAAPDTDDPWGLYASKAYSAADAMLKERAK